MGLQGSVSLAENSGQRGSDKMQRYSMSHLSQEQAPAAAPRLEERNCPACGSSFRIGPLSREGGLEPVTVRVARSFQEGITGPGLTARRVARHVAIAAANALMQVSGVGLNLVGIGRRVQS